MLYLVQTPHHGQPYILDHVDPTDYLRSFSIWGWPIQELDPNDANDKARLEEVIAAVKDLRREPLHLIRYNEIMRRHAEEENKAKASSKALYYEEKQAKKDAGEYVKPGLRKRVAKALGKKEKVKEPERYKDGVYVNHLEELQKKWFEDGVHGKLGPGHMVIRKDV